MRGSAAGSSASGTRPEQMEGRLPGLGSGGLPFARADLYALATYLALAIAFTWPAASTASTAIVGDGKDGWQEAWEMWWLDRALSTGSLPYHFATLYAPSGATNFVHSLNPILIVCMLPWLWAFGPLVAYNVACWLALALTAFAGYLLCRDVTGERGPAFVGGVGLGFAPHQLAQLLGHMDVASIQFGVLAVWSAYRCLRSVGRAATIWMLWTAAFIAASALSHPYTLILAVAAVALLGLVSSLSKATAAVGWSPLARSAISIGLGMGVAAPFLYAMASQLTGPDAPGAGEGTAAEVAAYSADLAAYAIPSPFHPVWGQAASEALRPLTGTLVEKVVFPGYLVLALGVLGILSPRTRRPARFWAAIAIGGLVLSLGPTLQVGGAQTGLALPGGLYYALPGSGIFRVPARFSVFFSLGLSVCAALGASALLVWRPLGGMRLRATAAIALLVSLELLAAPYRTAALEVDPWYRTLSTQGSAPGGLLEVPFDRWDARPLASQMVSGRQIAGGYLSRQPVDPLSRGIPPFTDFGLNRVPGRPLIDRANDTICKPVPSESRYLDIMRLANVRFLVLHKDRLDPRDSRFSLAARLFPGGPAHESEELLVYDTGGGTPDVALFGAVEDVADWGPVEPGAFRWTGSNFARIHLWSGSERNVELRLRLGAFGQARRVTISAGQVRLAEDLVEPGGRLFELRWTAPKGFSSLLIAATGRPVSPASLSMGADERALTLSLAECSYSL